MTTKTPEALAVLDRIIGTYFDDDNAGKDDRDMRKARDAFAELIESAKETSGTLGHAYHTVLNGDLAEDAHTAYQRCDTALAAVEELK